MGFIIDIFNLIFFGPVINVLALLYIGFQSINIPGALGFAIIILTVGIRFLVWPLMSSQIKTTKKMADLKPHLDELKAKHKDDRQALAQAQMALYKEHGVNPAGGCLPALLQIPVFIALYQAIINIVPGAGGNLNHINSLLYFEQLKLPSNIDPNFFGLNLGVKPWDFTKYGPYLVLVPIFTALLTFVQSKMMMPKAILYKEKEKMQDTMSAVQSQMVYLMPIMIGYFAFQFPVGLALYWNIYTILGIIQQHHVSGWGGMEGVWKKSFLKR